ncbi:uncharacterized protein LOC132196702 isoform X2 [Neocloeon triangulifer]|uniref:uncharacterized protein LOC132196702 isoform X2 n=1 Tax=Neocloeon triangulifer TaxID=2078957 RepID=UPI00286F2084|nr:uncharacterized protein LOC132196702 isoform X2 [Neocloeon triangulifer]
MSNSESETATNDEVKRPRLELEVPETSEAVDEKEVEYCFVCDELISGKKYPIANCLTNTSKSRLIEVLGRLVSEKYVVVVSNIDKICRTCANLLNNLDRLENEVMTTKQTILSSIERKYNLNDDDLYSRTMPKSVVFGNTQNLKTTFEKTAMKSSKPFKGTSVLPTKTTAATVKPIILSTQSGLVKESLTPTTGTPAAKTPIPQNVLMQCNQCQYTTNQRPVMLEHLRQHKAKEVKGKITADKPLEEDPNPVTLKAAVDHLAAGP